MYGNAENPLFLAKDVAVWIEHSDVSMMMRNVDDEEKVTNIVCTLEETRMLGSLQRMVFTKF